MENFKAILSSKQMPFLRQIRVFMEKFYEHDVPTKLTGRKKNNLVDYLHIVFITLQPATCLELYHKIEQIVNWFNNNNFKLFMTTDPFEIFTKFECSNDDIFLRLTCGTNRIFISRHFLQGLYIPEEDYLDLTDLTSDELEPIAAPEPLISKSTVLVDLIDEGASIPELECKVCYTNKKCVVITKCGHTFCKSCALRCNKCAECRVPYQPQNLIRIYL